MKITVEYDQTHNCLTGKFVGKMKFIHVKEYAQEFLKLARVHDCKRILSDLREADIKLSIADLYYASAEAAVGEFDQSWKRALVVKEMTKEIEFYEITATNKGLIVKTFDDYDEALAWL
jgi:hypothetical protein